MHHHTLVRRAAFAALAVAAGVTATGAWADKQSWDYKSYFKDPASGQYSKERFRTSTITVTPSLAGCEPFRYLIKNDGSGGVRQIRRGERWSDDGFDHGLTAKK